MGYSLASFIITLLPPLSYKTYELLYLFFQKRSFIQNSISEWVPLPQLAERYYLYIFVIILAGLSLLFAVKKSRNKSLLLFLPLIPLSLFVITGVRQTAFAIPAIFLCMIPGIKLIKASPKNHFKTLGTIALFALLTFGLILYRREAVGIVHDYPDKAMPFVRKNLRGNMFNEMHIGGYLLYQLGPKQKTFIDGRTDMFLPVVFPEFMNFATKTQTDDKTYLKEFNMLVKKYDVSWTILTTNRFTLSSRLGRIITNDPNWSLVYFDDSAKVYVKNSGPNAWLIKKYGFKAATPFGKSLYRPGFQSQAKDEYKSMCQRTKSAICLNALGFLLLEDQKVEEAEKYFREAIKTYDYYPAPKMNLAEIELFHGNSEIAIKLYQDALNNDRSRSLPYLRLGQILKQAGRASEARDIWQQGIKESSDFSLKQKMKSELTSL